MEYLHAVESRLASSAYLSPAGVMVFEGWRVREEERVEPRLEASEEPKSSARDAEEVRGGGGGGGGERKRNPKCESYTGIHHTGNARHTHMLVHTCMSVHTHKQGLF